MSPVSPLLGSQPWLACLRENPTKMGHNNCVIIKCVLRDKPEKWLCEREEQNLIPSIHMKNRIIPDWGSRERWTPGIHRPVSLIVDIQVH